MKVIYWFLKLWESKITKVVAITSGVVFLVGTMWSVLDWAGARPIYKKEYMIVKTQLEQIASSVLLLRFNQLMDKRSRNGSLPFVEQQELCRIARELQYTQIPGC